MTVPSLVSESATRLGRDSVPAAAEMAQIFWKKKKKSGGHVNSQKNVLKQRLIPFLSEPWETSGACAPMQRGRRSPRGDPRTRRGPPGHRTGVVPPLPSRALSGDAGNVLDTLSKQKQKHWTMFTTLKLHTDKELREPRGQKPLFSPDGLFGFINK